MATKEEQDRHHREYEARQDARAAEDKKLRQESHDEHIKRINEQDFSSNNSNNKKNPTNTSCFPASVHIKTPSGTQSIARISNGDMVMVYNLKTGKSEPQPVTNVKQHQLCKICNVWTEDGNKLRVTKTHALQTDQGWKRVNQLKTGDILNRISSTGVLEKVSVVKIATEQNPENVYNLIVAENYTFIADGFVASSFSYFRETRKLYHNVLHKLNKWNGAGIKHGDPLLPKIIYK